MFEVEPDDLVGQSEIAERARVSIVTVLDRWLSHPDFPRPMTRLQDVGCIWYWPAVQAWIERQGEARRLA